MSLQKTSLQLDPSVLGDMDRWGGLSRSEALRLVIERGQYLSTLNSENVAQLAGEYAPILREALADLDYGDYRLAVRSLAAVVEGFLSEEPRSWCYEQGDHHELKPDELVERLRALNPLERIGVLDCVVAERYRTHLRTPGSNRLSDSRPGAPGSAVDIYIDLPYGGPNARFVVGRLVDHLKATGLDYIIIGGANCTLSRHPKRRSLDYWLRRSFTSLKDTRQAVSNVIEQLIATGLFEAGKFVCPDSGRTCSGIRMVRSPQIG